MALAPSAAPPKYAPCSDSQDGEGLRQPAQRCPSAVRAETWNLSQRLEANQGLAPHGEDPDPAAGTLEAGGAALQAGRSLEAVPLGAGGPGAPAQAVTGTPQPPPAVPGPGAGSQFPVPRPGPALPGPPARSPRPCPSCPAPSGDGAAGGRPWPPRARAVPARSRRGMAGPRQVPGRGGQGRGGGGSSAPGRSWPGWGCGLCPGRSGAVGGSR